MTTGIYEHLKLIVDRKQDDGRLQIHRSGPFFEVRLNGALIGKVKMLSAALLPESTESISDECIRLPHYTVLLTDSETIDISMENILARERREAQH